MLVQRYRRIGNLETLPKISSRIMRVMRVVRTTVR